MADSVTDAQGSPPALKADFWEDRYQSGMTGWNLGQAAPPLVSLLDSVDAPVPGAIAVLGSGHGHDALLFAEKGFEVTGVDFAPSAIAAATAQAQARGLSATFLQRDIFDLADLAQQFDYVLEHTCFCAIAPHQRPDYVRVVHQLLRPGGQLIGLFWAHQRLGGPPFGTQVEELQRLFSPWFQVSLEPVTNSVPKRRDEEYLGRFNRLEVA